MKSRESLALAQVMEPEFVLVMRGCIDYELVYTH